MKTSKTTKRALLVSVLSLLLCASMLVGSTFAWFTDSVTANKNRIVAGNLDIGLLVKQGDDYVEVGENDNLFLENALWEPGHVEVVNLKVANLGTLALKYRFGINIASETPGTNKDGDPFRLSDYILFALLDGEKTFPVGDAGRAAAIGAAEAAGPKTLSQLNVNGNDVLYPTGKGDPSEKKVTLIVYMPTDIGNIANYKTGTKAPEIELGIKFEATQFTAESDGFGTNYDADAWSAMTMKDNGNGTYENEGQLYVKDDNGYVAVEQTAEAEGLYKEKNGDKLYAQGHNGCVVVESSTETPGLYTAENGDQYVATTEAFEVAAPQGGNVTIVNDIEKVITSTAYFQDRFLNIAADTPTNIDLADKTINIESATGKNGINVDEGASATFSNGSITMNKGYGSSYAVVDAYHAEITLDNMTVTNSTKDGACVSAGTDGGKVTIKDSTIIGGDSAYSPAVFCSSQSIVVIENSTIVGAIRAGSNSKVELRGGDYRNAILRSENKDRIIIYSGLFSVNPTIDPGKLYTHGAKLAPGSTLIDNGDGTWTVTAG